MSSVGLTVVVPAYNEEARLETGFRRILDFLVPRNDPFEVIVVNDGSTDRTGSIAEDWASRKLQGGRIKVIHNDGNKGKGHSVRVGMLAAQGEKGLLTDADLSTPVDELEKLEAYLGDYDLAIGSRDIPGSAIAVHQPRTREALGKSFNRVVRLLTGLPYRDTQCGFKLFRLSTCRDLFLMQRISGFVFDVELLFVARKWGLETIEVPVKWSHSPGSKVRPVRHAPAILFDLLRLQLNNARGLYSHPGP